MIFICINQPVSQSVNRLVKFIKLLTIQVLDYNIKASKQAYTQTIINQWHVTKTLVPRPRRQVSRPIRHQMKIALFTRSGNGYRKVVWYGQLANCVFWALLPVEYDSSVDVAHSVVIHLFGSTSMIHSASIGKRLPQTLSWSVTIVVAVIWERLTTLDIFLKTKAKIDQDIRPQDQDEDTKNVVSRPRHVSKLPIPVINPLSIK